MGATRATGGPRHAVTAELVLTTLPRLMGPLLRDFDPGAGGARLTRSQFRILMVLRHRPGLSLTRLGEFVNLEKGSLSGLVDGLAARGLVARGRDPQDRRRLVLHLSGRGRVQVRRMMGRLQEHIDAAIDGLAPRDRARLAAALVTLSEIAPRLEAL